MKVCALFALVALAGSIAAGAPSGSGSIPGWGTVIDPAGDCKVNLRDGKLSIIVPASDKAHDLSCEIGNTTAPLVIQRAIGDFVLQVKVDGTFQPSDDSSEAGRCGYVGGGLVIFADKSNYVTIARATLRYQGDKPAPYTNFEIRADGECVRIGATGDLPTDPAKPTWLRLERRGRQMLGAMSQDGKHWHYGDPKPLDSKAWDKPSVTAGIAALSTSTGDFAPIFSGLALTKAPSQPAPSPANQAPQPGPSPKQATANHPRFY